MKPTHNKAIRLYSKYVASDGFIFDFASYVSWNIFIPKESKYTVAFLLINNETQYVPLLRFSSKLMTYFPCFILDKLSLEKTPLNLVP